MRNLIFWPPEDDPSRLGGARGKLDYQLSKIIEYSVFDDDFIPTLFPDDRVGVIPSAFGCEVKEIPGKHPWVLPLIHKPDDVSKLEKPNLKNSAWISQILETIAVFREETRDMLPVHLSDIQGPLAVASLIWKFDDMLIAMYETPEAVHALLDIVTDAIIEFIQLLIDACGENSIPIHCPPIAWMPKDRGVAVSDDTLAVISPALYKEFGIPYFERISKRFGGLFVHSCGQFQHNFENLKMIDGLAGIHCGQLHFVDVAEPLGKDLVVIGHSTLGPDEVRQAGRLLAEGYRSIVPCLVPAETDPMKYCSLCRKLIESRGI